DGPAPGRRHLDLSLNQRLADFEIGIELAALEDLGLDLATGGGLDLAEIILHRDIAQMRGRGVERQPQPQRLVSSRGTDKDRRRSGSNRSEGKTAARKTRWHAGSSRCTGAGRQPPRPERPQVLPSP